MVGWHHRLNEHEFQQTLGDTEGQGMAPHSSTLAWKIPWTREPSGLYSPWSQKRVGHNLATSQTTVFH